MTDHIAHHPTEGTLQAYAAGTLDRARSLIVAMHAARCRVCREQLGTYEAVGGALLGEAPVVALGKDALAKALRALDAGAISPEPAGEADPLDAYQRGPWRWVGPGVYRSAVASADSDDIKVFMLKAAPGTKLPHHKHTGIEWTCVLEGAFEHEFGRFGPGDFDEADDTMEHKPTVCAGVPCICIVALQGGIALQSRLGRLLQPLIRL
jgi:putative transcriptional regulator